MNDPQWRVQGSNRPYGGGPGTWPRDQVPGPPPGPARPPGGGVPPGRDPGRGGTDPRDTDPRRRDPGWGGPPPGGPPTRRIPGQPEATRPGVTQPGRPQPARPQPARPQPGWTGQSAGGQAPGGPRDTLGRNPRRSPGPARWGALQGGLGVCIIVISGAAGTVATMVTRSAPGFLLGLLVAAGTVVAALAVRPRAGWMILPVPVLSYL